MAKQRLVKEGNTIGHFTVSFSDLNYNVIQRGCEEISGFKIAQIASHTCKISVMQTSKVNREKGYWLFPSVLAHEDTTHICADLLLNTDQ